MGTGLSGQFSQILAELASGTADAYADTFQFVLEGSPGFP